jgi:hypothetical protein
MSRGKIAPRLWALIVKTEVSDFSEDWPGQARELRALDPVASRDEGETKR